MPFFSLDAHAPTLPAGNFWIAPNATVVGDVRLGADVSIWFGAVIRADDETISIGAGSNVQDNAVLHADPGFPIAVGERCTIGHAAIVHGCRVGDDTLIGMGAKVLNGARVGTNCLIAAGALVGEGKVIPDNSLVIGVPGKVAGSLDEAASQNVRLAADRYVAWLRRFRDGLASIDANACRRR